MLDVMSVVSRPKTHFQILEHTNLLEDDRTQPLGQDKAERDG